MQNKLNKLNKLRQNANFKNLSLKSQHKIIHQIRCIEFQLRFSEVAVEQIPAVTPDCWDEDNYDEEFQWSDECSEFYGVHW